MVSEFGPDSNNSNIPFKSKHLLCIFKKVNRDMILDRMLSCGIKDIVTCKSFAPFHNAVAHYVQ